MTSSGFCRICRSCGPMIGPAEKLQEFILSGLEARLLSLLPETELLSLHTTTKPACLIKVWSKEEVVLCITYRVISQMERNCELMSERFFLLTISFLGLCSHILGELHLPHFVTVES